MIKKAFLSVVLTFLSTCALLSQEKEIKLEIAQTSDIHGNIFPYNSIDHKINKGGLARLSTFVNQERQQYGKNFILIDNGDILQGQPAVYYSNFVNTKSTNIAAAAFNYLHYDIGNMGNHDIETGHAVYDKWIKECNFPILGANIIRESDEKPYLPPYKIVIRKGIKIAILGMITPAIPTWVNKKQWSGLHFADMLQTAKLWMPILKKKEKPDLIIGLFHSGKKPHIEGGLFNENASVTIAEQIDGFDLVMIGHDHTKACFQVKNPKGKPIWIVNPEYNGNYVGVANITFTVKNGKVMHKNISCRLEDIQYTQLDTSFVKHFAPYFDELKKYLSQTIGSIGKTLETKNAYFGPSAFIDLIHTIQLEETGADISFVAPLSYNFTMHKGEIKTDDMFNLYKYENLLYTMHLTGQEIKDALEMSYGKWINEMHSADDHVLKIKQDTENNHYLLTGLFFNFDSAAGIRYEVDATKPIGKKIKIISMTNGSPFNLNHTYKVAINSYRGNGGGGILTEGAGIRLNELHNRILTTSKKDLRHYMIDYIKNHPNLNPQPLDLWKLVPEKWTQPAVKRDYKLLFN